MTEPLLTVDRVTLRYETDTGTVTATDSISFTVHQGDRLVLLGPSGCGKSSLLKSIGGYLPPAGGEMRLHGRIIREPGPDRMMVFQEFDQLLPWKTVAGNVRFALEASGRARDETARQRARVAIEKVGLARFENAHPHTLSGGMKQRVAIARAMAMEPDILLMDEPFAALDALTRTTMQDEVMRLWEDTRFTLIFVTHSISEAIKVGSRILLLSPHPGRLKAEITSDGTDRMVNATERMSEMIHRELFASEPAAHAE